VTSATDEQREQQLRTSALKWPNLDTDKQFLLRLLDAARSTPTEPTSTPDRCEQETPFKAYTEPRCSHERGHEGPHLFQSLDPQRTALEVMPK
jgi:hypothetical protein